MVPVTTSFFDSFFCLSNNHKTKETIISTLCFESSLEIDWAFRKGLHLWVVSIHKELILLYKISRQGCLMLFSPAEITKTIYDIHSDALWLVWHSLNTQPLCITAHSSKRLLILSFFAELLYQIQNNGSGMETHSLWPGWDDVGVWELQHTLSQVGWHHDIRVCGRNSETFQSSFPPGHR